MQQAEPDKLAELESHPLSLTSPLNRLPSELWQHIFACIAEKNGLSSASLVCKSWLQLIRKILFASVTIMGAPHKRNLDGFISFLNATPDVYGMIHRVELYGGRGYSLIKITLGQLDLILSKLPRLQSITLDEVDWFEDSDPTVILHGPYSLQKFELLMVRFRTASRVLGCLGLFADIGELSMARIPGVREFAWPENGTPSAYVESETTTPLLPTRLAVSSLSEMGVLDTEFYLDVLKHTRTIYTLQSLSITFPRASSNTPIPGAFAPDITSFLEAATNLSHLTLDLARMQHLCVTGYAAQLLPVRMYAMTVLPTIFAKMHALASCTLRTELTTTPINHRAFIPDLWAALVEVLLAFPPSMRRVEIRLENRYYAGLTKAGKRTFRLEALWLLPTLKIGKLESALRRFPKLESLVFCGSVSLSEEEKSRITAELPDFAERGVIQFNA